MWSVREEVCSTRWVVSCSVVGTSVLYGLYSAWRMHRTDHALRPAQDGASQKHPQRQPPAPFVGHVPLLCKQGLFASLAQRFEDPWSVLWIGTSPFIVLNTLPTVRQALATPVFAKPKYFGYRSAAIKAAVSSQKRAVAAESEELDASGDYSRVALENLIHERFRWLTKNSRTLVTELAQSSVERNSFSELQLGFVSLNLQLLYGFDDIHSAESLATRIARAGLEFALRMLNPFRKYYMWFANVQYMLDVFFIIGLGRKLCRHLDKLAAAPALDSQNLPAATWVHAWLGKVGKIGKLGKVIGLLMASTQTVPLTAIWSLFLVATAGEHVRNKVFEELQSVLGDLNEITVEQLTAGLSVAQLDSMVYLDAVVKETLRLYPPFPVLQRECQLDTMLESTRIKRGTIVYVVPWMIHHNPTIWSSPEQFRPERFMDGSASHGDAANDYAFIPFGRGSRMCAGYRLALVEVKLVLLFALFLFQWDVDYAEEPFPALNMVPTSMQFSFRPRPS